MDIGKLLERVFFAEIKARDADRQFVEKNNSFPIDTFLDKLRDHQEDIKRKYTAFEQSKKDCVSLYDSRMHEEDLYRKRDEVYNRAKSLMDSAPQEVFDRVKSLMDSAPQEKNAVRNYYDAHVAFMTIRGHRDADQLDKQCVTTLDLWYDIANKSYAAQRYEDAIARFESIADYRDAGALLKKCRDDYAEYQRIEAAYTAAVAQFEKGLFYKAYLALLPVKEHCDAASYITRCEAELDVVYNKGVDLLNKKQYVDALKEFQCIERYKDSAKLIKKCNEEIFREKEERLKAENAVKAAARKKKTHKPRVYRTFRILYIFARNG